MIPLERDVEAGIIAGLQLFGYYVVKTDAGQRDAARGRRALPVGWPDILAIRGAGGHACEALLIEVKRPGEKPTTKQLAIHRALMANGIKVVVARSWDDIEPVLREIRRK